MSAAAAVNSTTDYFGFIYGEQCVASIRPHTYEDGIAAAKECLVELDVPQYEVESAKIVFTSTKLRNLEGTRPFRVHRGIWASVIRDVNELNISLEPLSIVPNPNQASSGSKIASSSSAPPAPLSQDSGPTRDQNSSNAEVTASTNISIPSKSTQDHHKSDEQPQDQQSSTQEQPNPLVARTTGPPQDFTRQAAGDAPSSSSQPLTSALDSSAHVTTRTPNNEAETASNDKLQEPQPEHPPTAPKPLPKRPLSSDSEEDELDDELSSDELSDAIHRRLSISKSQPSKRQRISSESASDNGADKLEEEEDDAGDGDDDGDDDEAGSSQEDGSEMDIDKEEDKAEPHESDGDSEGESAAHVPTPAPPSLRTTVVRNHGLINEQLVVSLELKSGVNPSTGIASVRLKLLEEIDAARFTQEDILSPLWFPSYDVRRFKTAIDKFLKEYPNEDKNFKKYKLESGERGREAREAAKRVTTAFIDQADEWTKVKLTSLHGARGCDVHAALYVLFVRRRDALKTQDSWV